MPYREKIIYKIILQVLPGKCTLINTDSFFDSTKAPLHPWMERGAGVRLKKKSKIDRWYNPISQFNNLSFVDGDI